MKKAILSLFVFCSFVKCFGQKSADQGDFTFVTGKDDGNKKFIKYTAFNITYSPLTYEINENEKYTSLQNTPAVQVSWESYNTYSKRFAGSTEINAGVINDNFIASLDYGLYFIMFKGLYLKIKGGYGILSDVATGETPYVVTYGSDLGYLFKLRNAEGKRPVFLSLFAGYGAFSGTSDIEHESSTGNYYYTYSNSYSGSGFKAGIKFMIGPKN
jgi:hypothetical protein